MKNQQIRTNNSKEISSGKEFIWYINSLSASIKEFYVTSKNINDNKNLLVNLFEEELNNSKSALEKILKEINYNQIYLFDNYLENIKKIFNKFKLQIISEEKNLFSFYEDTRILINKLNEKQSISKKTINGQISLNNGPSNVVNNYIKNISVGHFESKEKYNLLNSNIKNKFAIYRNNKIFSSIEPKYLKKKNETIKNLKSTTTSPYKSNNFIDQNFENKKLKTRNKIFSIENFTGNIINKTTNTQFNDKEEIISNLKEENNIIHQKSIDLMKIINKYKKEIEKLKKENIKLKQNNLSLRTDLYKDNNNNIININYSEKNLKTKTNTNIKENKENIISKNRESKTQNNSKTKNNIIFDENYYTQENSKEINLFKKEINNIDKKLMFKKKKIDELNINPYYKNDLKNENLNNILKRFDSYKKENEEIKKKNIYFTDKIKYYQQEIKKMKNELKANSEFEINNQNILKELKENYEKKIYEINLKNKKILKIYTKNTILN